MFVHIFSQAVLERSNYRVTQKERNPNFKAKYLFIQAELSIGIVPIQKSSLCPLIEPAFSFSFLFFFWSSLLAYVKKKIFF